MPCWLVVEAGRGEKNQSANEPKSIEPVRCLVNFGDYAVNNLFVGRGTNGIGDQRRVLVLFLAQLCRSVSFSGHSL